MPAVCAAHQSTNVRKGPVLAVAQGQTQQIHGLSVAAFADGPTPAALIDRLPDGQLHANTIRTNARNMEAGSAPRWGQGMEFDNPALVKSTTRT